MLKTGDANFLSADQQQALLQQYGYHCWYCGKPVLRQRERGSDRSLNRYRLVFDHVVPKSRQGSDHPSNCVPSCNRCNAQKGARTREEYRGYLEQSRRVDHVRFHGESH